MLNHTGIVVSDLARSRRFYDVIAKALGLATADNGEHAFLFGRSAQEPIPYLWIGRCIRRTGPRVRASASIKCTLRSIAPSRAAVDEFHRAAVAAGGRDNGKPGPRAGAGDYYGAFVLDPDGNNIEACVQWWFLELRSAEPNASTRDTCDAGPDTNTESNTRSDAGSDTRGAHSADASGAAAGS